MAFIDFETFAERHNVHFDGNTRHLGTQTGTELDSGWRHDAWSVTIVGAEGSCSITYRMGLGHEGRPPKIEDVLCTLAMDAQSIRDADSFEEWAEDLGYDTDSRKAEASYEECKDQTERLEAALGARAFALLIDSEYVEEMGDEEPTEEELCERFERDILPMIVEQYEKDGQPDWPARREAFNDWTDALCEDGEISEWLYENIEHPACCGD